MNIKKIITGKYAKLTAFSAAIAVGLPLTLISLFKSANWLVSWAMDNYGITGGLMAVVTPLIFIYLMVLGVLAIREKENEK